MEYQFTLHYRLAGDDQDFDAILERLGEAGCDDALVGTGLPGRLGLDFTQEASSVEEAMKSALADVEQAIPLADLVEAVPDYVGLSDAAEAVGVSRQNQHKLMIKHKSFPPPIHAGSFSLWHLADLMAWLQLTQDYQLEGSKLEVARVVKQINLIKQSRDVQPLMGQSFAQHVY
ncbi:MAG: Putative DNA-binding protein [Fluviibacter phosphoraccumulans EoVTN8]